MIDFVPLRWRFPRVDCMRVIVTSILCVCAFAQVLQAQKDAEAVRAAYVYNLTKYVSWSGSRTEIIIGYFGDSKMATVLQHAIEGKTVDGHIIHVLVNPTDPELDKCNMVYLSDMTQLRVRTILAKTQGRGILTVGESDEFMHAGGMVGLVRSSDQIQIEVNTEQTQKENFHISSRLLNLAQIVHYSARQRR